LVSDLDLRSLTDVFGPGLFEEKLILKLLRQKTPILLSFNCQTRIFYINFLALPAAIFSNCGLLQKVV
jgi:hypothetical protein